MDSPGTGLRSTTGAARSDRRGAVLALLCGTQLLLLIDFSIVNIALPGIRQSLNFTPAGLSWVAGAYALTFGGFLLLGGRLADLLGRRRLFVAGMVLFGVASLIGGLAQTRELLLLMRGVQGAGAALIAPAVLSLITTLFAEGADRNRAIGWFTAASASGFSLGVLAGGVLTEVFGWRSVFLMNVPLLAVAIPLAYLLLDEPRRPVVRRGYDLTGAVLGVAGLTLMSYGLSVATRPGGLGRGVALVVAGLVLLGLLVLVESRARDPLVPLGLFRLGDLSAAYGVGALASGVLGTATLLLSLYLQEVRQLAALWAGLSFLPFGITIAVCARNGPRVAGRFGVRRAFAGATLLMAAGAAVLSAVTAQAGPPIAILPGMLLVAAGGGVFFTLFTIAGTTGVPPGQQGVAAALVNTSTQVGTAFATAALVTLAGVHSRSAGDAPVGAQGFAIAFGVAAAILVLAAVLAVVAIRPAPTEETPDDPGRE